MMKRRWISVCALVAWSPLFVNAQVDRHVWIATESRAYELDRTGSLIGTYGNGCTSALGPCEVKIARDGVGNVYVGQLGLFFPGVSGSLVAMRSGVGTVAVTGLPVVDVVCDSSDNVWSTVPVYSQTTQSVTSYRLERRGPGLIPFQGSWVLPIGYPRIVAHPIDGTWLALSFVGSTSISRLSATVVQGSSLVVPGGIVTMAADRQGRLWVIDAGWGLQRIVEGPNGALTVDLTVALSAPASLPVSMHIDLCGTVHVHVREGGVSVVRRVTEGGILLPSITYPVAFLDMGLGTRGGYWFTHAQVSTGFNLVSFNGLSTTLTNLEPSVFATAFSTLRGDLTGGAWCALNPGSIDSDGDGISNAEEAVRGTDFLDPGSFPPLLSAVLNTGGPTASWSLTYTDADPTHAGLSYLLAVSLGTSVGFPVGPGGTCPIVPLDPDAVFLASLAPSPLFLGFQGILTPQGTAVATLAIPVGTPPGIPLFLAGITWRSATGVVGASSAALPLVTP